MRYSVMRVLPATQGRTFSGISCVMDPEVAETVTGVDPVRVPNPRVGKMGKVTEFEPAGTVTEVGI